MTAAKSEAQPRMSVTAAKLAGSCGLTWKSPRPG
jgi:hypothetical protein